MGETPWPTFRKASSTTPAISPPTIFADKHLPMSSAPRVETSLDCLTDLRRAHGRATATDGRDDRYRCPPRQTGLVRDQPLIAPISRECIFQPDEEALKTPLPRFSQTRRPASICEAASTTSDMTTGTSWPRKASRPSCPFALRDLGDIDQPDASGGLAPQVDAQVPPRPSASPDGATSSGVGRCGTPLPAPLQQGPEGLIALQSQARRRPSETSSLHTR